MKSKVPSEKQEAAAKFKDYFDWSEPLAKIPSHRMLAIRRGESEGFLMMRITPPEEAALPLLEPLFVTGKGPAAEQVRLAVQDSYKRLLGPAIEVEMRMESKKRADAEAIRVFADNLRELLLASPLGQQKRAGHRSRLPHRLQNRLPGPAGQAAAQRRHLSHRIQRRRIARGRRRRC